MSFFNIFVILIRLKEKTTAAMKSILLNILLLFICIPYIEAATQYYFKQIFLKNGLSQSTVSAILTDYRGVLWIGTQFGLNSFDQQQITPYYQNKNNDNTLPHNNVLFLCEDEKLNLWVGTENGLARYNKEKDNFIRITDGNEAIVVYSYVLTDDGIFFFGNGKVYKYSYMDNVLHPVEIVTSEKIESAFTEACLYDSDRREILLGCRWGGMWIYHYGTGRLQKAPFTQEQNITALYKTLDGTVWISSYARGVFHYDREGILKEHLTSPGLLSNNIVMDMKEKDGKLWIATDGGGISVYDQESCSMEVIKHISGDPHSIPVNSFNCLYNDAENNMWAGSIRGGLIGMKEIFINTYQDAPLGSSKGLSNRTVTSMYEDKDKMIWMGTDGEGLNRFDPATEMFRQYPSTYSAKVVSIISLGDSELLLSLFGDGLYRFNKKTGLINEYRVAGDEKSRQIFRSGFTVHMYRLNKERFYLFADSVYLYDQPKNECTVIPCMDKQVALSALQLVQGTDTVCYLRGSAGLFKLDCRNNLLSAFYRPDKSIGTINAGCPYKEGNFWIGTTSGLYCYEVEKHEMDSIENEQLVGCTSLAFDFHGRLWVGTHDGMFAYMPDDQRVINFGESDGVFAKEFIFKSPLVSFSGDVYMAGISGLVRIKNDLQFTEKKEPVVNLLDIALNGISVGAEVARNRGLITIPWNYTSLNAKVIVKENDMMRRVLFRFYIRGEQEEIVQTSNPVLALHNLFVGKHQIYVSCNKKYGGWSSPVKIFSVVVTPPWWRSSWFYLLFIVVLLSGFGWLTYQVIRRRKPEATADVETIIISNPNEQFLAKLNEIISNHLTNPDLDVNFVAEQMAMSRASLYSKLKLVADTSIGDYINKLRMEKALLLLADKQLSIQEVSEKAGFTHQRYFSTVFKQLYGMTPSRYRQEHFS